MTVSAAESARRSARRPVGGGLGLVQHHVVGINAGVGYVVGAEDAIGRSRHRGAGECAGLVGQVRLGGGDTALFCRSHLHLEIAAGGGAGGLEYLGAGHGELHRVPGLPGEDGGQGFQVYGELAAKAAANLHRDHLDLGNGDAQEPGRILPDTKMALAAAPDGQVAVCAPESGSSVGLDVPLVDGGGIVLSFNHHVRLLEALLRVAHLDDKVVGYVGGLFGVGVVPQAPGSNGGSGQGSQPLVEDGGVILHGVQDVGDSGQHLVLHVYQGQGFFGHVGVGGSNRGNGVPLVEGLAGGYDIVAQKPGVYHGPFAQVGCPARRLGKVLRRYHCLHLGMGQGLADIYGLDASVGMGASENLAVEKPRQVNIRAILGAAGYLVRPVVADGPGAYHAVFFGGQHHVGSHGPSPP